MARFGSGASASDYQRLKDRAEEMGIVVPPRATAPQIRALINRHHARETAKMLGVEVADTDTADEIEWEIEQALPGILEKWGFVPGAIISFQGRGYCEVVRYNPDTANIVLRSEGTSHHYAALDVALHSTLIKPAPS